MSNRNFIDALKNTVLKDSWLTEMYGTQKTEQQSELKKIFTESQTEELTAQERAEILARKETLEEKVERLEAKMAVLAEELDKNQESIKDASKKIAIIVSNIEDNSETLVRKQKNWAQEVVRDVMTTCQDKGYDGMVAEMYYRMSNFNDGGLSKKIDVSLSDMKTKKREITELCATTTNLLNQRTNLETQYGVTKTAHKFMSKALESMKKSTTFTNSDYNSIQPVYSTEKLDTTGCLFDNNTINVSTGLNSAYEEGSTKPTAESIKEKYADYIGKEATGTKKYNYQNEAIQALGNAIDNGLLTDLNTAGIKGNELVNFFAENFSGAMISKNANGGLNIPYGHGTKAREIFSKLNDYIKFGNLEQDVNAWTTSAFLGSNNTWDENKGNTISSNNQIKSLSENYCAIFNQFKEENFTFKEAMYALFNPDTGLYKDCGISYDLSKQTGTPNYDMEYAGDKKTAELYKNVATEIYNIWGVKPNRGTDLEINQLEFKVKRTDPLSFRTEDGTEFSFITDRNNDGKFSGKEEFIGGQENINWFEDLKSLDADGNNILEGDELNNLGLFGQKYENEAEIKPEQTTKVNYILQTAQEAGIEKIDLNDIENIDNSTGERNLNNAEIFNDSFKFTMDGIEYEAKRKDETDEFMNTVYNDAYGLKFDGNIGFEENYVDKTINDTYDEYDSYIKNYDDVIGDANVATNIDGIYNQAKENAEKTLARGKEEANITIREGQNATEAKYNNKANWENIKNDVIYEASKQGIDITANFLEQAKGIYTLEGGTAKDIIAKCSEMFERKETAEQFDQNSKEAWSAIIECTKKGVDTTVDKIFEKLNSGEATTAKEVANQLAEELGTVQFVFTPEAEDEEKYNKALDASIKEFEAREKELYSAFNEVFKKAGAEDKVVNGLYQLVQEQMANENYMQNKTGEELAEEILKKFN